MIADLNLSGEVFLKGEDLRNGEEFLRELLKSLALLNADTEAAALKDLLVTFKVFLRLELVEY